VTYRVLSAVLGSIVVAAACGRSTAPPPTEPKGPETAVTIAPVAQVDVPSVFEAGGILRARVTATVASRVLASITAVRVRPGDRVQRGQAVVDLDARELTANRVRADAAVAAADGTLRAADADVAASDAALAQARVTRDRIVTLFGSRSATAQERDDATAAFAAAEAHVAAAVARRAAAASAVDAARADADAAGVAASYAILTAAFDGVIAARHADPGDMATPGAALLTVEADGALNFETTVDEARLAHLAMHQAARVRLDNAAGTTTTTGAVTGRIVEIARVNSDSHSFVVKIELPAAPGLRSGLYGRAEFDGAGHRALVVPASAVVRRGQLAFVFTVDAGRARLRQVSPGSATAAGIEVTAGLSAGESVIVSPAVSLADGARVRAGGAGR
jgi:RND family efflux transporter MFP subunit